MIDAISPSPLTEHLRERIRAEGPVTFFEWMQAALYDPANGYYCRSDRRKWGRQGDYRTSPERSSLFGATFARYFASVFEKLGNPSAWTILELGAGDGRFAAGMLQTLDAHYPQVFSATRYVIDEASSDSRSIARKRLLPFGERVAFEKLETLAIDAGIVFSNELLDAFPVHRVKMTGGRLQEFYVTVDADGKFIWALSEPSTPRIAHYLEQCDVALGEEQIAEVNLGIEEWLKRVAACLRTGYVVTVDYGSEAVDLHPSSAHHPRYQGTLRSFQRHRLIEDVLSNPGEQDLTSTVNWTFIKNVGESLGLKTLELERQDRFLLAAGLLEQLELESRLAANEADKLRLSSAALEMILPTGMSSSFQVLVQRKG